MGEINKTPFLAVYDSFLSKVTDDMYLEMTEHDTFEQLQDILINAIPRFEFPRVDIFDYETGSLEYMGDYCGKESDGLKVPLIGWIGGTFNIELSQEEINVIALSMVVEWLGQQLAITDLTRMKYTGQDFKMTSQANHMAKLKVLMDKWEQECFHMQRLYGRRKRVDGSIRSTIGSIMTTPNYGFRI